MNVDVNVNVNSSEWVLKFVIPILFLVLMSRLLYWKIC